MKFDTFANGCILNHIQVFIRREGRKKHSFVTRALSLDEQIEKSKSTNGSSVLTRADIIPDSKQSNKLDETVFSIELGKVMVLLPPIAKNILCLLIQGYSVTEAADKLHESRIFVKGVIDQCLKPLLVEIMELDEDQFLQLPQMM